MIIYSDDNVLVHTIDRISFSCYSNNWKS